MPPAAARWLALAVGLAVAALFPLPFWIGMGILGWKARWQVALLALIGLGIALLAVWVAIAMQRVLGVLPPAPRGPQRVNWAAEQRRVSAWLDADPARARWRPLVQRLDRIAFETLLGFERRYQELAAHPVRARYCDLLLTGDWRSDAEIDYREDPARVVTCAHLAPIERDLRRHGIRSAPIEGVERKLWTQAYLTLERLAPHYDTASLGETIIEDHPHDPGTTLIECRACDSFIDSRGSARFPPEPG